MNRIMLLGRLTKDPEIRYTPSGACVAQFTLAVDRPYAAADGKKEADFIPVVIWGKSAELAGNSLGKGQRALVEGRVQIRSYDANDGSKRWVTEVIADRFEFIERKADAQPAQPAPPAPPQQQPKRAEDWTTMGSQVFDEEIPF